MMGSFLILKGRLILQKNPKPDCPRPDGAPSGTALQGSVWPPREPELRWGSIKPRHRHSTCTRGISYISMHEAPTALVSTR